MPYLEKCQFLSSAHFLIVFFVVVIESSEQLEGQGQCHSQHLTSEIILVHSKCSILSGEVE